MTRKGFTRTIKPLEILTEDQMRQVHRATLDILRNTGVTFKSEWALNFFEREGCPVDRTSMRVRLPEGLIEECLRQAPSSYRVEARDPANDLIMGGNTLYYTHSAGMQTVNLDTYEPRDPSKSEYVDCVKILDALPNVDFLACYPYFGYEGMPPVMAIPESVALKMRYSTKHQCTCYSNESEIFNIQMAQAVGQEITGTLTCSPPLTWGDDAVQAARRMIEAGFAVTTVDGNVLGGTGPATPLGTVAVCNAEHLSMIALVQLLDPGHRISVGHFACPMNMRSGSPAFGQIGGSISNVIWNQMWRHYRIPCANGSPGYVDSKMIDFQAGYEKGIAALASAASGVNFMLLHLGVSAEISAHPVQAILDDDVAGMVGRFIEGEVISDETLALDVIEAVGPIPGHYLGTQHTRDWCRREQFVPTAADRSTYPEWIAQGKKSALDHARARMEEILASHEPEPLSPTQEEDIQRILEDAREFYRKRGEIE
jgi:trimethylamine---corrinoid protein Co-methyltransferase